MRHSPPLMRNPREWEEVSLAPADAFHNGVIEYASAGSTPSTRNEALWDGEYPWLTPRDITRESDELWFSQTERSLSAAGLKGMRLHPPGTVMLTKRAPVGAVALNASPMAVNQGIIALRCISSRLMPIYLSHWLLANRLYLVRHANGSTYPELYLSDLEELVIACPPMDIQQEIVAALSALQFSVSLGPALLQASSSAEEVFEIQRRLRSLRLNFDKVRFWLLEGTLDPSAIDVNAINKIGALNDAVRC